MLNITRIVVLEPFGQENNVEEPRSSEFNIFTVEGGPAAVLRTATAIAQLLAVDGSLMCIYEYDHNDMNAQETLSYAVQIWRAPAPEGITRYGEAIGTGHNRVFSGDQAQKALDHLHLRVQHRATAKRLKRAGEGAFTTLGARVHPHVSYGHVGVEPSHVAAELRRAVPKATANEDHGGHKPKNRRSGKPRRDRHDEY